MKNVRVALMLNSVMFLYGDEEDDRLVIETFFHNGEHSLSRTYMGFPLPPVEEVEEGAKLALYKRLKSLVG